MVGKIVVVFNQKGGVGKTSIAMHTAGTFGKMGLIVKLLDMDRQNTATGWAAAAGADAPPFPATVMSMATYGGAIHREFEKIAKDCDLVIVDCPPAIDSQIAASALSMADLAIIPCAPKPADFSSSAAAKDLAKKVRETNPDLKVLVVANMVKSNTSARMILEQLAADKDMPLAKATIGDRVAYSDSVAYGISVQDVPGAKRAVEEMEALCLEIYAALGMKLTKRKGNARG